MQLLALCLDWLCLAFADGVQDEIRLNQLILGSTPRPAATLDTAAPLPPRR